MLPTSSTPTTPNPYPKVCISLTRIIIGVGLRDIRTRFPLFLDDRVLGLQLDTRLQAGHPPSNLNVMERLVVLVLVLILQSTNIDHGLHDARFSASWLLFLEIWELQALLDRFCFLGQHLRNWCWGVVLFDLILC